MHSSELGTGVSGRSWPINPCSGRTTASCRTSPLFVKSFHIFHPHAENEEVLLSGLLGHLHVGSVHGADGQGSVEHELHVPGARGLCAGGGDLLRQVGGRDDWGSIVQVLVSSAFTSALSLSLSHVDDSQKVDA